jgi:hypothetical protein
MALVTGSDLIEPGSKSDITSFQGGSNRVLALGMYPLKATQVGAGVALLRR